VDSCPSSRPPGSQTSVGMEKLEDVDVKDGCLSVYVFRRSDQSAVDILRTVFT